MPQDSKITKTNLKPQSTTSGANGNTKPTKPEGTISQCLFRFDKSSDPFNKWKKQQFKSDMRDVPNPRMLSRIFKEAIVNDDFDSTMPIANRHFGQIRRAPRIRDSGLRDHGGSSKKKKKTPGGKFEAQSFFSVTKLEPTLKDLSRTIDESNRLASEFLHRSGNLNEQVDRFNTSFEGASYSFTKLVDFLSSIDSRFAQVFGAMGDGAVYGTSALFCALFAYCLATRKRRAATILLVAGAGLFTYYNRNDLYRRLEELINDDEEPAAQNSFPQSETLVLGALFVDLLNVVSDGALKVPSSASKKFSEVLSVLSAHGRNKRNISSAFTDILNVVERLLNYVLANFTRFSPILLTSLSNSKVESWRNRSQAILDKAHTDGLGSDIRDREYCWNLLSEGRELRSTLTGEDSARLRTVIDTYFKAIETVTQPLMTAFSSQSGDRVEPFVCLLRGLPGVGKSTLMDPLCVEALKLIRPEGLDLEKDFNLNHYIFSKNSDSPYYDGYRNQPIFKKDEMFQKQDIKGAVVSEAADFIAMVNSAPYPLNMANLTGKGATYFRSPFFIGTTNIIGKINNLDSIREPDAVNRRISFSIVVEVKEEYTYSGTADSRLRFSLNKYHPDILKASEEDTFFTGCYKFSIRDEIQDCIVQSELSWDELVVTFRCLFKAHLRRQEKLMAMRSQYESPQDSDYEKIAISSSNTPFVMRRKVEAQGGTPTELQMRDLRELYDESIATIKSNVHDDAIRRALDEGSLAKYIEFLNSDYINTVSPYNIKKIFLDYGLHVKPENLSKEFEVFKFHAGNFGYQFATNPSVPGFLSGAVVLSIYIYVANLVDIMLNGAEGNLPESVGEYFTDCRDYIFDEEKGWSNNIFPGIIDALDTISSWCSNFVPSWYRSTDTSSFAGMQCENDTISDACGIVMDTMNIMLDRAFPKWKLDRAGIYRGLISTLNPDATIASFEQDPLMTSVFVATVLTPEFIAAHSSISFVDLIDHGFVRQCRHKYEGWSSDQRVKKANIARQCVATAVKGLAVGFAIAGTFKVASFITSLFFDDAAGGASEDDSEEFENQYGEAYRSYGERKERFGHRSRFKWRTVVKPPLEAQFLAPNTASLKSRMTLSCFEFSIAGQKMGFATALCGDFFLVPYHFCLQARYRLGTGEYKMDDHVTLHIPGDETKPQDCSLPISLFLKGSGCETRDFYVFRSHSGISMRNVLRCFAMRESVETYRFDEATLHTVERGEGGICRVEHTGDISLVHDQTYGGEGLPQISVDLCYRYGFPTRRGDCGAPLIARETRRNVDYIVGIHVAGVSGNRATRRIGFSTIVTREDLEEVIRTLQPGDPIEDFEAQGFLEKFFSESMPYPSISVTPPELERDLPAFQPSGINGPPVNRPPGTNIVRSSLDVPWDPKKVPAALKPVEKGGVTYDPMTLAINRYSEVPEIKLDPDVIAACVDDYFNKIKTSIRKDGPDLSAVDFATACSGIPALDFANGLSRSSSPGYPYSQWRAVRRKGGKKAFFGDGDNFTFDSEECSALLEDVEAFISSDEPYPVASNIGCIFQDTLKDELVSKAKRDSCKTRLVSACPLHVTIAWRMFFMRLIVYLNNKRYDLEMGVGVNCVSTEWIEIQNRLLSNSHIMQDGDQSGFDTNQHPTIQGMIFDRMFSLIDFDEGTFPSAKENFRNSYIRSTHVCDKDFYRWNGSLPSGHPLTITFNCIYLCIAFRCAWVANGLPLKEFARNVCLITYGDDSILSVKPAYADRFDHAAIAYGMASIGLNYTDALKRSPSECAASKTMDQISFLKRKFVYSKDFGTIVAPLEIDSILERVCWSSRKGDQKQLMASRCDDSLLDLVLHGREVWDRYGPDIVKAYESEYADSLPHNTWELCLNAVREQMA